MYSIVSTVCAAGSLVAAAQADGLPTSVLTAAGIAFAIGFLLGSVPTQGANRGWEFDGSGAVLWGTVAALMSGGAAIGATTGNWGLAITLIFFGVIFGLARYASEGGWAFCRHDLSDGVNRAPGETPKERFRAAKRMYYNGSFHQGDYYATRGLKEFDFGDQGIPPEYLDLLKGALPGAARETCDILVLLVRELPDEAGQPAVLVVRGASNLRKIKVEGDGLVLPNYDKKVPAASIAAFVGYAWR